MRFLPPPPRGGGRNRPRRRGPSRPIEQYGVRSLNRSSRHATMKILVAEDDRASALRLCRTLERLGHAVDVVHDGADAWRRICDGRVGLLISDWEMPEIDGLELCRRIRARADALYIYVIMLTSRDSRDDRLEGLQAGADDFLTKPLDAGELVARLSIARRILAMQEQLRAHAAQLAELHATLERQNSLLERKNALLGELAVTD